MNNIQVAIVAFAGGMTFGVLTMWAMFQNGMLLGVLAGVLGKAGARRSRSGRSSCRTARSSCPRSRSRAAAGSCSRGALIAARRPAARCEALRRVSGEAARVLLGTVPLFVVAGLVEGFVTPSGYPDALKLALGALLALALAAYLGLAGRGAGRAGEPQPRVTRRARASTPSPRPTRASASARVAPWVRQPGSARTSAIQSPSSVAPQLDRPRGARRAFSSTSAACLEAEGLERARRRTAPSRARRRAAARASCADVAARQADVAAVPPYRHALGTQHVEQLLGAYLARVACAGARAASPRGSQLPPRLHLEVAVHRRHRQLLGSTSSTSAPRARSSRSAAGLVAQQVLGHRGRERVGLRRPAPRVAVASTARLRCVITSGRCRGDERRRARRAAAATARCPTRSVNSTMSERFDSRAAR